jgi:drug/metabolite transporter (DMT)-like permease
MHIRRSRTRAILQALLVTFLWSTSFILIKIGLRDLPALTFAGLRYSLAFVFLLPLALRRDSLLALQRLTFGQWALLIGLGISFYAVTQGSQFVALSLLPAITISLLLNFTTVVVLLPSMLFLNETPRTTQVIGILIFLVGVLLYFSGEERSGSAVGDQATAGIIVALIAVVANAIAAVTGRAANRDLPLATSAITMVSMGVGAFILLGAGITFQGLPRLSLLNWATLLWLAGVNTAVAFTLWNHTLRTLTAVESSIINNTMLIQIAILAWVFLGERLTGREIAGLLVAAIGILLVQVRRRSIPEHAAD